MTLIARIREWQKEPELRRRLAEYSHQVSQEERLHWQLEHFNQVWQTVAVEVPYYADLLRRKIVPARFEGWEEFLACMPVADRNMVGQNLSRLANPTRPAEWWRVTGGSTGQPRRLPAWYNENRFSDPDKWVARSWYGVNFSQRCFWLWGQSHLFQHRMARIKRQIKDLLLGHYRFPADNLSTTVMQYAGEKLLRLKPDYVRGYSIPLLHFALANQGRAEEFKRLNLKVVIATGECFPNEKSQLILSSVLHAPLAQEYGASEAHTIAHTYPNGGYRVFWRTYFLEGRDPGVSGQRIVRLTSLFPMCFPLIRYELGDEIELEADDQAARIGLARVRQVLGREEDYIELPDGSRFHNIAFNSVLNYYPELSGYQLVQDGLRFTLFITTPLPEVPQSLTTSIRLRFSTIHPLLVGITVQKVAQLSRTVGGKTKVIIRQANLA